MYNLYNTIRYYAGYSNFENIRHPKTGIHITFSSGIADNVINKVIEIALTDGHPVQSAALKMCVDRVLPMSYFDKEKQGGSVPTISINISGMNTTTIDSVDNGIIDTDITDIEVSE
jgi:hypothetical protein